jgi:ABC-type multidrug transport system fused ATPase/permease subunit
MSRNDLPITAQLLPATPIRDKSSKAFAGLYDDVETVRLREVCAMARIVDFIELELRNGFQTTVGERGVRLSEGERQRPGLARALYHRPSVLILDETTSVLDTATEAKLIEALRNLSGKLTIVIVAHRLSTLAGSDEVVDLGNTHLARAAFAN